MVQVIGLCCSRAGKEFQFGNFPLNIICQIEQKTFITFWSSLFILPIIKFHKKTISLNGNQSWSITNKWNRTWTQSNLPACLISSLSLSLSDQVFDFLFAWSVLCLCLISSLYLSSSDQVFVFVFAWSGICLNSGSPFFSSTWQIKSTVGTAALSTTLFRTVTQLNKHKITLLQN